MGEFRDFCPSVAAGLRDWKDDVSGRPATEVAGEIAAFLAAARSVLITAHVRPDGDAFGSEAALALSLGRLGKRVRVLNDEAPPVPYRDLLPSGLLEVYDERLAQEVRGKYDVCVLLDTSEPERTGLLRPVVFAEGQRRACVDHHLLRGAYSFDHHLVVRNAPATGCLVLLLIDLLGVPLDRATATALWLAIATDTGWFRFANTDSLALAAAARLRGHGLDPERLYATIYGSHSVDRTRLLGKVLAGLRCELDGRLVWSLVTREARDSSGVGLVELDGFIDHLKGVGGVEVAALITELEAGTFKVSLRSVGTVGVEEVARRFGGGGHDRAAGYRFAGSLPELVAALREAVRAAPERRE